MPKGPDPRANARPLADVPALLRAGAEELRGRRFWHAHEAWEEAWHALRAADRKDAAELLHGLILVAAALENATRGKEAGFKRQAAEGLHLLRAHLSAADELRLVEAPRLVDALTALYLDACRRRDWAQWNGAGWRAPEVTFA